MKTLMIGIVATMMAANSQAHEHIGVAAESEIINNEGKAIGTATMVQGNEGVLLEVKLQGLPAGKHGMHFHAVGTCEDHHHFKKAGGHIMPSKRPHGYLHSEGPHEGNLPNLIVHEDGSAHVELYTELVSVDGALDAPALLDDDGSTLMIHVNEDDHVTQPIGGAGARIACGVIKAAEKRVITESE